jgi:hypothetical protein
MSPRRYSMPSSLEEVTTYSFYPERLVLPSVPYTE